MAEVVKTGTSGADKLIGTTAADSLSGLAGNDTLIGDAGNDTLNGGTGTDRLEGGAGNDTYQLEATDDLVIEAAGGGVDTLVMTVPGGFVGLPDNVENLTVNSSFQVILIGNNLANVLTAGSGNDMLFGLGGSDTLKGGGGDDYYFVNQTTDVVIEGTGAGYDALWLDVAAYTLPANVEDGMIWRPAGGSVTGNGTANYLAGFTGADKLSGMGGDDALWGSTGHDTLTGGAGYDAFEFAERDAASSDTITDFTRGQDVILLNELVYGLGDGALPATAFKTIGTGGTVDSSDRILYNAATGQLYFDPDGSGGAASVLLAVLTNKPALSYTDFWAYDPY